jgi:hypothetical protein
MTETVARPPIVFNQAILSREVISDRLEIQQLLVDYSTAIDRGGCELPPNADSVVNVGATTEPGELTSAPTLRNGSSSAAIIPRLR